jgi:hypothetical protein
MKQARSILALVSALTAFGSANAQEAVDIALHEAGNGTLEVRVVPRSDFDGVFAALVFTLRWDADTKAQLGEPLQDEKALAGMPIARSGGVHEEGGRNYQIYSGFGMQRLDEANAAWKAGQAYTVATIPVKGSAQVELVNDAWTGETEHNGDYYVSLNGEDMTGSILRSVAVGGTGELGVSVVPNPNQGAFTLTIEVPVTTDLNVEVVNTLGSIVHAETIRGFEGIFRKELDLTGLQSGVYYLKVRHGERTDVHKVIFQ